jgi:hypothetical protein
MFRSGQHIQYIYILYRVIVLSKQYNSSLSAAIPSYVVGPVISSELHSKQAHTLWQRHWLNEIIPLYITTFITPNVQHCYTCSVTWHLMYNTVTHGVTWHLMYNTVTHVLSHLDPILLHRSSILISTYFLMFHLLSSFPLHMHFSHLHHISRMSHQT